MLVSVAKIRVSVTLLRVSVAKTRISVVNILKEVYQMFHIFT